MKRWFARAGIAVLGFGAALSYSLPLLAADEPTSGTILTLAGTGKRGFSGDGGRATEATLYAPRGLAVDAAGNLYIGDFRNDRVRKVDISGIITTVAGTGEEGDPGDDGPAREASLLGPNDLAVDGSGNLFIADTRYHRVRKVSPDGIISTVAGTGEEGFEGDGGPAVEALLGHPEAVAVDAAGNLFIADAGDNRVRRVDLNGTITTVAGGGEPADEVGDGGPATAAQLYGPAGLAADAAGNLFIAEYGERRGTAEGHRVRKVSPDGMITTVAGTGDPGFSGDGGPATQATLTKPFQIVVDTAGNLFISDWGNYAVRKVSPDGIITTIAGNGKPGVFSGEGGLATAAALRGPSGLVVDAAGNLFIADSAFGKSDGLGDDERVLKVVGVAAPGLIGGGPFPKQ